MRGRGRLPALGLVVAVAACAAKPQAPAEVAYHPAAPAGIDGFYRGIARLIRADIPGCPRSGPRSVTIEGNALSLKYRDARATMPLSAVVGPDGGVHGSDGVGSINGQISGTHLDVTVASPYCEVRYALDKQ